MRDLTKSCFIRLSSSTLLICSKNGAGFPCENAEKDEDVQESEATTNEKQQRNEAIIPTSSIETNSQSNHTIKRKPLPSPETKQSMKKKRKKNDPPEGQLLFFF